MTRILLHGALGKMGRMVTEMAAGERTMEIVAGIDRFAAGATASYPLFETLGEGCPTADVLVDYSRPDALPDILAYCKAHDMAAVLCTTGYGPDELRQIEEASAHIAIFKSANMSLGASLLADLAREAAAILRGYDIEIVETHHSAKVDAPSGTALLLADAINEERFGTMDYTYDRHARRERREEHEIGIHSLRGGTVTGHHEVHYMGQDEVVTLSHTVQSRAAFAKGTLRAASFLCGRAAGCYNMQDLLADELVVTSLRVERGQAMFTLRGLIDTPSAMANVFDALAERRVFVDMISRSAAQNGCVTLSVTIPEGDARVAAEALVALAPEARQSFVKITASGQGMARQAGVASRMFAKCSAEGIGLAMVTTSETSICLLVATDDEERAVSALREAFSLA